MIARALANASSFVSAKTWSGSVGRRRGLGTMCTRLGMGEPIGAAATPLQRVELRESALAGQLESTRKLKSALVPLYQALDGAQKQVADKLLVLPMMGMM